ncbi:tyrosine-type recombinase/integrase [Microvirga sp. BT689]|uniref:tyrosine-type recombinase/integrase n=1 Tax=Microvirga arvi TaxID=2778731 RepID=UPI0019520026|nr:tyrosine-type recombinase/integrase [Microvirga arvi]MBM6579926.1 tyrosine-type recombinase/integrase [Microvirga arvi]
MDETHTNAAVIHRIRAVAYQTTPDFPPELINGRRTRQGFVLLFTATFHPVEPANLFLIDRCKGYKQHNTQKSYADDLAQWWTYLHFSKLAWDEVTNEDIEAFREALTQGVSVKTSREFAPATIERRIGTINEFYRWAHRQKLVADPIAGDPAEKGHFYLDRRMLPHVGGKTNGRQRSSRHSRQADEDVDPISIGNLRTILAALGPAPGTPDNNDKRPVRDRLIAETSLFTGMRVEEVCKLTVYQILDLRHEVDPKDRWKTIPLTITVTKGNAARTVAMYSFLVASLLAYIDGERNQSMEDARNRGKFRSGREPSALFVNGVTSSRRDVGEAISEATAMRAFTKAVRRCGLMRVLEGYEIDPETGAPAVDPETDRPILKPIRVPKHTFHDLRHTFAVQFYWGQIRAGNPSPWKKLQALLGHKHLSTTTDIYGRHVNVAEPKISDDFAHALKRQLDEAP